MAKLALGEAGLATYAVAMNDPSCKDLESLVVVQVLGGNEDWERRFSINNEIRYALAYHCIAAHFEILRSGGSVMVIFNLWFKM